MPSVTFSRAWNWRRDPLSTVHYLGERSYNVSIEVAKAARAAGALKRRPSRSKAQR